MLRQEVDEYYGSDGFWCECYAWNSAGSSDVTNTAPRSAKSRRTVIQAACKHGLRSDHNYNKKLSYCWETVRRESMPRIAEVDVEMTT